MSTNKEWQNTTSSGCFRRPRLSQFDEQDEATVREIWHTVERNKSLSTELARRANIFDTKHPGTPIYQIIQTLHATREYEPCHRGVTH